MYVLVSLGSAAPVVQESNKAIMDLKVNLGFCRNVKIRVFWHMFTRLHGRDLTFLSYTLDVNTCQL